MSGNQRQALGRWGETLAENYLCQRGYQIIERNARTRYGELDLVAWQGPVLVFIEVKTRSSLQYGHPESAITPAKRRHLIAAAAAYLQVHPELDGDWRIDVVAIQKTKSQPQIDHFENAVF